MLFSTNRVFIRITLFCEYLFITRDSTEGGTKQERDNFHVRQHKIKLWMISSNWKPV